VNTVTLMVKRPLAGVLRVVAVPDLDGLSPMHVGAVKT